MLGVIGPAAVITYLIVALIVAALVIYLTTIAYVLKRVSFTLGTVLIGVRAIANQCEPVRGVVDDIARDIASIQQALRGLLPRGGGRRQAVTRGRARR